MNAGAAANTPPVRGSVSLASAPRTTTTSGRLRLTRADSGTLTPLPASWIDQVSPATARLYGQLLPAEPETLPLGDDWKSRAQTAYDRAAKAVKYESDNMPYSAGSEWQKIFGTDIPSG